MQRVSVVGNSGAGKSHLARRIARAIDAPYVELDAIHHLPGWTPMEPERFVAEVATRAAAERWVIDGNYRRAVVEGPVWARADTVVWLDLPRRTVMRQVIGRTVRRTVSREELWNGNREPFRNLWAWAPEKSIVRWAWTQHAKYAARYGAALESPDHGHLEFVRLRSRAAVEHWLAGLDAAERPT